MRTIDINYYTGNYWKLLDKKCDFWEIRVNENSRELRIAKFKELLLEINDSEEPEDQPYLRVTLSYKFIMENDYLDKFKEVHNRPFVMDYKEIADYFIAVLDDIEYVAANDKCSFPEAHNKFFTRTEPVAISYIIHAIAEHCSKDVMQKYINCVVNSYYGNRDKNSKAIYFAHVIREYALKEDYQSMVDYGKWIINILKDDNVYSSYSKESSDFRSVIRSIHTELDKVFKKLDILNVDHEAMMNIIREEEAEKDKKEAEKRLKELLFKNIKNISSKKERTSKFKESLKIIKDTYPELKREYRVKLCYSYAEALYEKFKETGSIDYKELADYLASVMNDIEYIAANDTKYYADYQDIYRIGKQDFILCIVEAIVKNLSEAEMHRFMHSVVTIDYNKKKLDNLVNYFRCVIQKYTMIKEYQKVADYAKWFIQVYKEKEYDCTAIGVYDFQVTVDAIHTDIDEAYKALNIDDADHEKRMVDIRKRAAETPQERRNREKAELYDQAQRARACGDMDEYRGYMSVLGDIGR